MKQETNLYPRHVVPAILEALADTPVVCLLGPRQCGKTTLVRQMYPDRAYISMDNPTDRLSATDDPVGMINQHPGSVTIDEIQKVPELISAIKASVDADRRPGRFLLTGSVNLLWVPGLTESLAGRMEIIELFPLIESEKNRAEGNFLCDLLHGELGCPGNVNAQVVGGLSIWERISEGGFPEPLKRTPRRARDWRRQYVKRIAERDLPDVFSIRNSELLRRLIELLARRTGQLLNIAELCGSLGANRLTLERYLEFLESAYLIRRVPAWHSNQTKRLVKTPKLHFVDTGVAATITGVAIDNPKLHRVYLGHLLESFVVQQIYAQSRFTDSDLRIFHYRDKDQVEVNLVLTVGSRVWGIEVKSGWTVRPQDYAGLRRLADRCGDNFQKGIIFYGGDRTAPLAKGQSLAVPLSDLWTR